MTWRAALPRQVIFLAISTLVLMGGYPGQVTAALQGVGPAEVRQVCWKGQRCESLVLVQGCGDIRFSRGMAQLQIFVSATQWRQAHGAFVLL